MSFSTRLIDFNDGHLPGGTSVDNSLAPKLAIYDDKTSQNFASAFDNPADAAIASINSALFIIS